MPQETNNGSRAEQRQANGIAAWRTEGHKVVANPDPKSFAPDAYEQQRPIQVKQLSWPLGQRGAPRDSTNQRVVDKLIATDGVFIVSWSDGVGVDGYLYGHELRDAIVEEVEMGDTGSTKVLRKSEPGYRFNLTKFRRFHA
jgi:hypothetical protein